MWPLWVHPLASSCWRGALQCMPADCWKCRWQKSCWLQVKPLNSLDVLTVFINTRNDVIWHLGSNQYLVPYPKRDHRTKAKLIPVLITGDTLHFCALSVRVIKRLSGFYKGFAAGPNTTVDVQRKSGETPSTPTRKQNSAFALCHLQRPINQPTTQWK